MANDNRILDKYLKEIGRERLLSDEEELQLSQRIQQGDNRAVDELIKANLTFVVSMAKQYAGEGPDMEDLISEGNMGMMEAALHFKAQPGKRFVAFAAPYIRRCMQAAIEQHNMLYKVPADARNPKHDKRAGKALSIDAPVGGSVEMSLGRVIADANAENPEDALTREQIEEALLPLLDRLNEREQYVVKHFYGVTTIHQTMAEIGYALQIKRERVRQIRNTAVRKICKLTKNSGLKQFLKR